jgi:isopentenyl-diphosphate delta-isomerase
VIVDYILFCSLDVTLEPNMNEVSDAKYVSKDELENMFQTESCKPPPHSSRNVTNIPADSFTPWFKLIARDLLYPWWDEMLEKSRAEGWNPEKGVGKVRAGVLEGGDKVDKLIKMI